MMDAAAKHNISVIILDRPKPIRYVVYMDPLEKSLGLLV